MTANTIKDLSPGQHSPDSGAALDPIDRHGGAQDFDAVAIGGQLRGRALKAAKEGVSAAVTGIRSSRPWTEVPVSVSKAGGQREIALHDAPRADPVGLRDDKRLRRSSRASIASPSIGELNPEAVVASTGRSHLARSAFDPQCQAASPEARD